MHFAMGVGSVNDCPFVVMQLGMKNLLCVLPVREVKPLSCVGILISHFLKDLSLVFFVFLKLSWKNVVLALFFSDQE